MKTTVMKENLDWEHVGECNLDLDTLLEKEAIGAEYPANRRGVFHKYLRKYFVLRMSRKHLRGINAMSKGFRTVREDNRYFSNNKMWLRKREVAFSQPIPQEIVEEINLAVEGNENLNYGVYDFLLTQNGYTLIYIVC